MRLLWVKAGGLVPPDVGGKIRSYNILKELAKRHEVTFFSFYAAHPEDEHGGLEKVFHRSVCVPLDIPPANSLGDKLNFLRAQISPLPYSVWKYCRPVVRERLLELVKGQSYDVVICDFLLPAAILPWEMPAPKVIFTHNVEAMIWKRHFEVATSELWKLVSRREFHAMEKFERRELKRADHVLAVSATDRDTFAAYLPPSKIDVIPTGVDVDFFRPRSSGEVDGNNLVFTGSMDWLPNEEGLFHFVEETLPLIRQKRPEVTLTIVGRKPSARLKAMAERDGNIHVTGRVEDIRPYVDRAAVYIVPLRVGSGTRLKIFEAMAMGQAIVSTTLGAEGLPVTDGKDILLRDDSQSFADAVLKLMSDLGLRARLGIAARELVEESYSWAAVTRDFEGILEKVINSKSVSVTQS